VAVLVSVSAAWILAQPPATIQRNPVEGKRTLIIQTGHADRVTSVALSRDSQWLVTGCQDGIAKLWETATGREVRRFVGHRDAINAVALSSDGKWLATGSGRFHVLEVDRENDDVTVHTLDQWAILWDVSTGKPVQSFKGHDGFVKSVALSGDGKWLVTGSEDNTARLWDTKTGKQVRVFRGHTHVKQYRGMVNSVVLSRDGKWLVTAGADETARLWEVATGKQIRVFSRPDSAFSSAALSADGKWLVTAGGWDQTVALWEVGTGKLVRTFPHPVGVDSVALSGDGKWLATASHKENVARLWDVQTGTRKSVPAKAIWNRSTVWSSPATANGS
jgi:WD40 repeat protein